MFSLFFFLICQFFRQKGEFVAHISEDKSRRKCGGGAGDGSEQRGNGAEERVRKWFFFLKSCQAMSSQRKERDKRRGEECRGVKSVYLPKESDSRLPANNPSRLPHSSPWLPRLFHSIPLPRSLLPRACFQRRPCQFTVTLHHLFSLFLIFLFHLPAFPLSIKHTWTSSGPPPPLSLFSFLWNIRSCFLPPLSQHFILTFQNWGTLSRSLSLSPVKHVSIVHMLFGCVCVCLCVCVCVTAIIQSCAQVLHFMKYCDALRRRSESHHSYCLHAVVNSDNNRSACVCFCVCVCLRVDTLFGDCWCVDKDK